MAIEFRHAYRTVGAMISQCKMIIHTAYKPPPRHHEFTAKKAYEQKRDYVNTDSPAHPLMLC